MIIDKKSHTLAKRDLMHIVHPCAQLTDLMNYPPLTVSHAEGSYIYLQDGQALVDGISSWWCKPLGHRHPAIIEAISAQLARFEHVILANTTHDIAIEFAETLTQLCAPLNKILFASDGACAIEMAMKMSLHVRQIQHSTRHQFLYLENAYHGETALTMSVSDLGIYRDPYAKVLTTYPILRHIPYVNSITDPLWNNCEAHWQQLLPQLNALKDTLTAIMVEPIVQGAGGMKIYSQDFLRRLYQWCQEQEIHFIADEIMTGLWRTGHRFACDYANITPDFLCLSKGLTGGALPLSVMLTHDKIYDNFIANYQDQKNFLHSHTQGGNALALAAALSCLQNIEVSIPPILEKLSQTLEKQLHIVAQTTGALTNVRVIGGIAAAELIPSHTARVGFLIAQAAAKFGALIRPLGNTLYWLPPLNIDDSAMCQLTQATTKAIQQYY